jgi:hypothetical protein
MKKLLDVMAAVCLVFGVGWDEDFGDDEYVLKYRAREEGRPEIRLADPVLRSRAV